MTGLIETLLNARAETRLFARSNEWITAGDICDMAARGDLPGNGDVFLHATSAAHFCAGLLAAAAENRALVLPAHPQATYLAEIGCAPERLITDDAFANDDAKRSLENAALDPLLVFFTSGSTGAPKRVEKNLSRLEIEARGLDRVWGSEAAHVVATVSHQHIYGLLFRIVWPLLSRRTADDTAATYWEDLDGKLAGATLVSSPAHLTRLPPRRDLFTPPPGLICSSGQLLPADAAQKCAAAFGKPVTEVLGSTETGGIAWRRQTEPEAPWTPLPNVEITQGEESALIVCSPYLQIDAPMHTGDVIEPLSDGRFLLKPRGDRVAKIDGKRVSLTRVEEALAALPSVEAAAALTLPDRKDALAAIVALNAAGRAKLEEAGAFRFSRLMRAALSSTLEPAERPKHWRFTDAIATDAQGKRVLSRLRAMFAAASPLDQLDLDIRSHSDSEAEIAFTLPADLVFFEGHFPGRAILPGVAQAHLAVLIAQKLWRGWPSDANLARLKFRRVLLPGDAIVVKLKHDARIGRVGFSYMYGDIEASTGEIGGVTR